MRRAVALLAILLGGCCYQHQPPKRVYAHPPEHVEWPKPMKPFWCDYIGWR